MGKNWHALAALLGLLVILVGCAPKVTTTPVPAAPTIQPPAPASTPVPKLSAEDAAWAKVVTEAKKEGKLTLYTFAFIGDAGRAVSKALEDKYGIKLEMVGGVGSSLAERIRSEQAAGKYIADTFDTSPALILISKDEGRTTPWGFLPVLAERDVLRIEAKVDPEGHMLTFSSAFLTTFMNTTLVKAGEQPRSFKDLLEPKWKGNIIIASPSTVPSLPYLYVWGRRQGVLDDEYFRRLAKQDIKVAPTIRDKEAMLARGEGAIVVVTSEGTIGPLIAEGAPIRPIEMQEGVMRTMTIAIAPVRNSPHPNAAKVFVNWLLTAEGQTIFHRAKATMPIRKDVTDFRPANRLDPAKAYLVDLAQMVEASKIQREATLSRLMGLEK